MSAHRRIGMVAALVALAAVPTGSASAQDVTYSGSVGVASGTYIFDDRTTTFTLLNGLRWSARRFELSVSLPFVVQNSTALTLIGGRPVPTGGPDHETIRQREPGRRIPMGASGRLGGAGPHVGAAAWLAPDRAHQTASADTVARPGSYEANVGDPVIGATLRLFEGTGFTRAFSLQGYAKAPVADLESGIGTEEWDYAAGASITVGSGTTLLIADATWWMYGDLPDLELEDGLSYGLAVGRLVGRSWSILGSVSGASKIVPTADPPVSIGIGANRRVSERGSIGLGGSVGLTESASDFSLYLSWSTQLTRSRF